MEDSQRSGTVRFCNTDRSAFRIFRPDKICEQLAPYAYYLRKFKDKNYQVPGEEAQKAEALMEPAVNSKTTYSIFENVELIRPSFTYPDGTESVLTNAEYSQIIKNPDYDRDFRNEVYELRNSMRMPYSNTYASLLEGEMRKNIADALSIDISRVSVKATTEEGLGFTGEGLGIAARAIALIEE